MNFIDKLERKYRKFGIHNLTLYVVGCYVIGYILMTINPMVLQMMSLDVSKILRGEIWRLVTWVIYPPSYQNVVFFIISVAFFYYPIGSALERAWGSFRYTLYIFSGVLFTIIGAFLLHFLTGGGIAVFGGSLFSTYYISMSVFLAFAVSFPDMQILLMYVIPIKMKWMGIVYGIMIGYEVFSYLTRGYWFMVVPILASLLNFIIFFFSTKNMSRYNPHEIRRKQKFQKAVASSRVDSTGRPVSKHKCAICGRTELDSPELEFRFCSRCNGNYEYCQEHLFTHTHVK